MIMAEHTPGRSIGTAKSRVFRARRQLESWLLGEETEGRFALLRVQGVQGAEEPHSHAAEDESLYVLEGELTISQAAADPVSLRAVLLSLAVGAGLVVPALVALFAVAQRGPERR